MQFSDDRIQVDSGWNCSSILMMAREDARNMYIYITEENSNNEGTWLVILKEIYYDARLHECKAAGDIWCEVRGSSRRMNKIAQSEDPCFVLVTDCWWVVD
jgi:hypothetical protein